MFSGGIGSWAAARILVDRHGPAAVTCLFADVKGDSTEPDVGEDEDTYRFIADAIADLGCEYVRVADGRTIWEVFRDVRYLGNARQANCSHILKQAPARKWIEENRDPTDTVLAIGIDWTETHRIPKIIAAYKPWAVTFPMAEPPYLTKEQMIAWAGDRGLSPPRLYGLGFSHNNCGGGCVRAGQAQFRLLLEQMPDRFARWEQGEEDLRSHLDRDVAILRDRRGGITKPLPLAVLRSMRERDIDANDIGGCGCFTDGGSDGAEYLRGGT